MTIIWTIVKLLIVLGIVATIHEFGHFLFAKMFKMTVNEFSIGFGPKIIQRKRKETKYSLRWIPLGGYVALEGEDNESTDVNAFCNKPCYQRIIVLVAGVLFNAILATMIFLGVNLSSNTYGTRIANLDENSVAYIAGLREGDKITKLGNKVTHIYQDVMLYNNLEEKDVNVEYVRNGKKYNTVLVGAVKEIGYIGVYFDTAKISKDGKVLSYVEIVEPGMPASEVKIKSGDKIISINNENVEYSEQVTKIISDNPNKEVEIVVLRDEKEVSLKVTPTVKLSFDIGTMSFKKEKTTLKYSCYKSISTISQIAGSYVDLFKGKVKIKQLSGIVGIGEVVSRAENIKEFLSIKR